MNEENNNTYTRSYILGCGCAFFFPVIIISVAYLLLGIYPGGEYTPLILDLSSEHFPFYNFLNSSDGICSLFYQDLGGLGGGVVNSLQMYTGPFVLVFSLVPRLYVPYAILFMIMFQIGLCGLSEYVYLIKGYPEVRGIFKPLILSICYSLMSCAVVYTIVPVWLWGIIFLPLVAYGIDMLVEKGNIRRFILYLSLSIIFNYLTAYIIIIFSLIYFLYMMYVKDISARNFRDCFIRYFSCGVVSVALTAFSWLPVLCDLLMGKVEENRHPKLGFIRNPLSVIVHFFIPGYDGLGRYSMPFVFCGFVPLIFVILYFFNKRINTRHKIASLAVLVFFIFSFSVGIVDICWMFFAEPNGYPSRYSFTFSFFIILIAASELKNVDRSVFDISVIKILICVFSVFDCFAHSFILLSSIRADVGPYSKYAEYVKAYDVMEEIKCAYDICGISERTVKNWRLTDNDGILFGYSDIDYFSSSYNSSFHEFMGSLGLNTRYHILRSDGLTPVVASVFGVSHLIEYKTDLSAYYDSLGSVDELDIYGNSYSLPLMFSIESAAPPSEGFDSDDPFRNINEFLFDLSGIDGVFEELDHSFDGRYATVFVDEGRDLWMYAHSDKMYGGDIHGVDADEELYVYYDGIPIKAFANYISSYCVNLGFGVGDYASFAFDEDACMSGIHFASLDVSNTIDALNVLHGNSAYDFVGTGSGFKCNIYLDEDKYVLITLPYDTGFKIRDNEKLIDYYAYRGSLVCFKLSKGSHIVEVTYFPRGLSFGIAISMIAGLCLIGLRLISVLQIDKKRRA